MSIPASVRASIKDGMVHKFDVEGVSSLKIASNTDYFPPSKLTL